MVKKNISNIRRTTEQFITESIAVHGEKYDYSKVNYLTALEKVEIICKTHGNFWQVAISHLRGHGCAKCKSASQVLTTQQFIEMARAIHGDTYKNKQSGLNDKTYGDLYRATLERENIIRNSNYNIKYIWEKDWKNERKKK